MLPVRFSHSVNRIPSLFDSWPSLLSELADTMERPGERVVQSFSPDIDVSEFANRFEITVDLPGFEKENVNIEFDEGELLIAASREQAPVEEEPLRVLRKRRFGSFERRLRLDGVTAEVDASLNGGVLKLVVPKAAEKQPRKIELA